MHSAVPSLDVSSQDAVAGGELLWHLGTGSSAVVDPDNYRTSGGGVQGDRSLPLWGPSNEGDTGDSDARPSLLLVRMMIGGVPVRPAAVRASGDAVCAGASAGRGAW